MNWLRAGVLGANDGIVSVDGIVVGVAGAIFTAGLAGLVAGAVSMALGEYVSVSSQRDTEHALIAQERRELRESPEEELEELTSLYRAKGLSAATAPTVAEELTGQDPLGAHLAAELGIDAQDLANPRQAALASAVAFTVGALLPLLAVLPPPEPFRVPVCVVAVLAALALTGVVSARLGGASPRRAVLRGAGRGSARLGLHLRRRAPLRDSDRLSDLRPGSLPGGRRCRWSGPRRPAGAVRPRRRRCGRAAGPSPGRRGRGR